MDKDNKEADEMDTSCEIFFLKDVLKKLGKESSACGNHLAFAKKHDINPGYISSVTNGKRPPSAMLLDILGYVSERVYRKKLKHVKVDGKPQKNMNPLLTKEEIIAIIKEEIERVGSQSDFCKSRNISTSYLSTMLSGKRFTPGGKLVLPSKKLLLSIGYESFRVYRPAAKSDE